MSFSPFLASLSLQGRALRIALDGYLTRISERDFSGMGHKVRHSTALRSWMVAHAAATATTASHANVRGAATSGRGNKPARSTTQPYRDVLERLHNIDPLAAWLPIHNALARLSALPKHHLADPALAARLLGVDASALMRSGGESRDLHKSGALLGALFESLVTLNVCVAAQHAECTVKHLRTSRGDREVDLIAERGDGKVFAIEVKLSE